MMPYEDNAAYQEQAQAAPGQPAELTEVPVRVGGTVRTSQGPALHGAMFTVTIPASTAGQPAAVAQLLPQDFGRRAAYIMPITAPIVTGTSKEQVQSPGNVGISVPSGAYSAGWSPPITHSQEVWAANTSTAPCLVSVLVDTGGA